LQIFRWAGALAEPLREPLRLTGWLLLAGGLFAGALVAGSLVAGSVLVGRSGRQPGASATGQPVSADEFRRELVDLPLCGTPATGPLAGKAMCTIHFADGSATLAGSGVMARGYWQFEGDTVCRRDQRDPVEQERCVRYERLADGRYRNSDGVVVCIGPCAERR
jgi:hypothetical protein